MNKIRDEARRRWRGKDFRKTAGNTIAAAEEIEAGGPATRWRQASVSAREVVEGIWIGGRVRVRGAVSECSEEMREEERKEERALEAQEEERVEEEED